MLKAILTHVAIALLAFASSAQAQERQWSLDASGEDAFLVFGVPETDDIGLSFWCKIGSGSVSMFYPVTWTGLKNNAIVKIRVEAGDTNLLLRGKATSSTEGGTASLEVALQPGADIFTALKKSDYVVLRVLAHKAAYPLQDADIDGLLSLCLQS